MRILGPTLFGSLVFFVWAYAVLDIVATAAALVRNLPKVAWLIMVLLLPGVGAVAWLALGRPLNAGWAPGDSRLRQRRKFVGPEDRADWQPPSRPGAGRPNRRPDPAREAHPAGGGVRSHGEPRESLAAKERRLMEWQAELARREAEGPDSGEYRGD